MERNGRSAEKVLLSWSGGKDSALTLYELRKMGGYELAALVTTVTEGYDRISMHGVRRALLEEQADSIGLPLEEVWIPPGCTNARYEAALEALLTRYRRNGIERVAFGDIFLEDLRAYRENSLAKIGCKGLFPIWKRDTQELARTFLALRFAAIVVCVDPKVLDRSFAGRRIDEKFLRELPAHVDPCGEKGEFHSFVFDGPVFRKAIPFSVGAVVLRDSFYFCDLLPLS